MRPRHRIPSIFNLYMLDVMCGSLGAVVILWLYKDNQAALAEQEKKRLTASTQELSAIEKELKDLLAKEKARVTDLSESEKKLLADLSVLRTVRDKLTDSEKTLLAELAAMKTARDKLSASEKDLTTRLNDLLKIEASLRALLAKAQEDLLTDRKKLLALNTDLGGLMKDKTSLEGLLALRQKDINELKEQLASLLKDKTKLDTDLKAQTTLSTERKKEAEDLAKLVEMLNDRLKTAQLSMATLKKSADEVPKLLEELKDYRGKLGTEEGRIKALRADLDRRMAELDDSNKKYDALTKAKGLVEKDLQGKVKDLADAEKKRLEMQDLLGDRVRDLLKANRSVDELKTEKEKLLGDIARLRVILDQRFAGIELTGKRVVFLVDMSGSMDLIDEKTPAPQKWLVVRTTLAQLMQSLPRLEKYQVIVFSEKVQHLFGKPGEWIDYDPKTSPQKVRDELAKIKPMGGTNISAAMEAAFRYRADGLDTLYLFSDGLPNEGDGLTPEQDRTVTDPNARSSLLAAYIRRKLNNDWNRTQLGRERVKINSVGFYFESPDVGAFLWALSRENDGSFVGMSKP